MSCSSPWSYSPLPLLFSGVFRYFFIAMHRWGILYSLVVVIWLIFMLLVYLSAEVAVVVCVSS